MTPVSGYAATDTFCWRYLWMRILLVEDFVDVRMLLAHALGEEGHDIIQADDFPAAAAVPATPEACDAVVADVQLLSGPGIALAELARKAGVPILLSTGESAGMSVLAEQGIRHLRKPFPLGALINWVAETADRAAPRQDTRSCAGGEGVKYP